MRTSQRLIKVITVEDIFILKIKFLNKEFKVKVFVLDCEMVRKYLSKDVERLIHVF